MMTFLQENSSAANQITGHCVGMLWTDKSAPRINLTWNLELVKNDEK